ncbi:MAG: Spy/CpxP family protein refolding chaperone [Gammaproteobacteria bacterium]|nr:Spy/CpxP family protein refolding chaperone [Gammaproteobacteria bacterium]
MKRTASSLMATGVLLAATTLTGAAFAHADDSGPHHMGHGYPGSGYGGPGYGPPSFGPHGYRGMGGLSSLAEELDLSKEQRKSVRDIMDKSRSKARELGESMIENREKMDDVLDDKGYGADFDKLARHQGELVGEMIMLREKTRAQIEGVLTAEQKERFREYADDSCDRDQGFGWHGRDW